MGLPFLSPPQPKKNISSQYCRIKPNAERLEYNSVIHKMNNTMITISSFYEWLTMKRNGIDFEKYCCL